MHLHSSVCRKLTLRPVIIYTTIALFLAGCAGGGGVSSGTSDGSATSPSTVAGATRAVPEFSPYVVVDQSGNRELRLARGVDDIRYHGQSLRSSRTTAENAAQQQLTDLIQQQLQQWTQGKSVTRASSVVPFYRIPVAWSLDPTVPPNVLLQTPMGSPMATYVEDAASGFIRSFGVPTADGTYIWNWTWTNDKGTNTNVNYVYVVSAGNATLTQSINGSPPFQVYSGVAVNNATLNLSISQAAGVIGSFDDNTLENVFIGTWTVTETFTPGTQSVLGTFDMRMLAVQNVSTSPPLFDSKLPSTDPNSHTIITADIFALPASTSLAPNGWVPAGAGIPWRMPIINPAGPAPVKTFVGIAPITPSSGGKVGSISQIWSGEQDSSSGSAPAGVYQPLVQALGALDVGNALTRFILTQVSLEVPSVEITNVTITPTIDPSQTPAAELKADVVSTGFLDNFTIEWTVLIADAAGNIIHQATGTGTTADVPIDVQWDAKDPTGTVVPDGDYTFTVTAGACDLGGQPTRSLPRGVAFVRQPSGGSCIAALPVGRRATKPPKNITIKLSRSTLPPRWEMHPAITPGAPLKAVEDFIPLLDYDPDPNKATPFPDQSYSGYSGVEIHLTGFPANTTAKIRLKPTGVAGSGVHHHGAYMSTNPPYPRPAGNFLAFSGVTGSSMALLTPDAGSNPPTYTVDIPVKGDGTGDYPAGGLFYLPSEFAGQEQISADDARTSTPAPCNNPVLTVQESLSMNNVAEDARATSVFC